jgi:hypothetical protein
LVSLVLALGSNAVATTLTLLYDNGTTYVETNALMRWELAVFGRWVPVVAGLMLGAVYCGVWYFTVRRPVSSEAKYFMSFILFFIPAITLQDAVGDISIVYAGIPLLPLQGIEFSAAVYAAALVITRWHLGKRNLESPAV